MSGEVEAGNFDGRWMNEYNIRRDLSTIHGKTKDEALESYSVTQQEQCCRGRRLVVLMTEPLDKSKCGIQFPHVEAHQSWTVQMNPCQPCGPWFCM